MIVIKDKLVMLATPRTASRAVQTGYEAHCKTCSKGTSKKECKHFKIIDQPHHHLSAKDAADLGYGNLRTALFVRNPFDIAVSWWMNAGGGRHDLAHFLQSYVDPVNLFYRDGTAFVLYDESTDPIVLRYELCVQKQIDFLHTLLRIPKIKVPVNHKPTEKKTKPWQQYYDNEAYAIAKKMFEADCLKFNYDKDWYAL